jgi:hypothetical protein
MLITISQSGKYYDSFEWNNPGDSENIWSGDTSAEYNYVFSINDKSFLNVKRRTPLKEVREALEQICLKASRQLKLESI